MSAANVVQVHLGDTVPPFLYEQLRQLRLFNPSLPVFLILNSGALYDSRTLDRLGVTVVRKEAIRKCRNHRRFLALKSLDQRYWKPFWRSASERFFLIESFLAACGIKSVVHLENDVMLYVGLDRLMPVLASSYGHIAVTMDGDRRCIPGFAYIHDRESLSRMNDFVTGISILKRYNDMQSLGAFMREVGPPACDSLPVVPDRYRPLFGFANRLGEKVESGYFDRRYREFGGVFDAAALGQYLGGVDSRSAKDTRGFVNETAVYDPRNFKLAWRVEGGLRVPFGEIGDETFPVFNLHIHSKNLIPFMSDLPREPSCA